MTYIGDFMVYILIVQGKTHCSVMIRFNYTMMTSSNGNFFRVTGPLCGEITGHRLIPLTKVPWRRALMFSFICTWIKGWVNSREAGDLRCHRTHYDVTVMAILKVAQIPVYWLMQWGWSKIGWHHFLQTWFSDVFSWKKTFIFYSNVTKS